MLLTQIQEMEVGNRNGAECSKTRLTIGAWIIFGGTAKGGGTEHLDRINAAIFIVSCFDL